MTTYLCRTWWVLLPLLLLLSGGCASGERLDYFDKLTPSDQDPGIGAPGGAAVPGSGDSAASGSDGGACQAGGGCCTPSCAGKSCGASDGCGGTCSIGSGCSTSWGAWQAVNPDDPWDDSDPNYDGERGCNGAVIKDFGKVSLEATCRAKCGQVGATCCARDHRSGHKSCKAYSGKVVVVGGCTGCTASSCK